MDMGILVSLLVLSFLIFFHELGHFVAARRMGVQVDVFSIGFGKKIIEKKYGKTSYVLSMIPLGGYVKMKGQDDADPTKISYDSDSYNTKKPWQRIIILLAGPFANFVLAFLLYFAIAMIGVPKLLPIVGIVSPETPAYKAGLQKGDTILSIGQNPVVYWEDIGQLINASPSVAVAVGIARDNHKMTLSVTPKTINDKNIFEEPIQRKIIGISPLGTQKEIVYGFGEGVLYAWDETAKASVLIFKSVQKLITGAVGADKLGGVLTIIDITSQASSAGIVALLFFTALISVNLGVLNILPIPALDGGHIMFNLYEIVRGKAPSEAVLYRLTVGGWAILLGLMFLGLYNDINRLAGN
jgi:regulator of sigma E protease